MIDEVATFEKYGYYPSDLKQGSNKMIIVKCNNCGVSFSVSKAETSRGWGRYCSKSCKYEGSKVLRIERKCEICGKIFSVYESELRRNAAKYCSRSCMGEGRKAEKSPFWKGGEVKRKCEICGIIFFASQAEVKRGMARYCSKSCAGIGRRTPRIKRKCQTCGKIFFVIPSTLRYGWGNYCSKVCARKGSHHTKETRRKMALAQMAEKHHNWKGGKIERVCQICGNIFYTAPSNIKYGRGKYCSPSCRGIAQYKKIKRYCLVCGKEISIRPSKIKKGEGKFCSQSCMGKWKSENLKGENSPAWRGGISFEPYCSKFDDTFKEYIRDKFGRTCFLCAKSEEENGQKLSVHHVNYDKHCGCAETEADKKADDNECQFIPLCRSCNAKVNGNRDKWEKYFKNKLRNKLNGWYI